MSKETGGEADQNQSWMIHSAEVRAAFAGKARTEAGRQELLLPQLVGSESRQVSSARDGT